jgi:hypothetical protein
MLRMKDSKKATMQEMTPVTLVVMMQVTRRQQDDTK